MVYLRYQKLIYKLPMVLCFERANKIRDYLIRYILVFENRGLEPMAPLISAIRANQMNVASVLQLFYYLFPANLLDMAKMYFTETLFNRNYIVDK